MYFNLERPSPFEKVALFELIVSQNILTFHILAFDSFSVIKLGNIFH